MAKVTIKDVARAAGVGLGTASRALSQSGPVSPEARSRVLEAAERLHYRPNPQAQALRNSRTHTVGLLIPDVSNPYFGELAHAFERAMVSEGYTMLLGNANEDAAQQDRYLEALRNHRVDGLALAPQGGSETLLRSVVEDDVPAVFVDRTVEGLDIPSVSSDPTEGIRQVVDHLARRGHRRIGYIAGPQSVSTGRERLDAWKQTLADHGLALDADLVFYGDFQQESGRRGAAELIDRGVTALFAADSPMTLGALETCTDLHLRIGRDVDLVGFDDLSLFRYLQPAITTVSQNVIGMGEAAARMLVEAMRGQASVSVRLPTHLVERNSTHYLNGTEETADDNAQ